MMSMTKPGFRMGKPGDRSVSRRAGEEGVEGRPFSQAQILDLMKIEFARARRYGHAVACILMHVNRLAVLTDMHGTRLRQGVTGELCKLVREKTRSSDFLGSLGEDRYLVVLPHTDSGRAKSVASRILEGFGDLEVEAEALQPGPLRRGRTPLSTRPDDPRTGPRTGPSRHRSELW